MIVRDFLIKFFEEMPSRGLDSVDLYISSKSNEDIEPHSYKIINISNEGSNDGIFITIEEI